MSDLPGWIAVGTILFGTTFMAIGCFGVFRLADVLLRVHAMSQCLIFGFVFVILGSVILVGDEGDWVKALLAIGFQCLTAPVASQVVARTALLRGIQPIVSTPELGEETDRA